MSLVAILLYSIVTLWLVITLFAQHPRFQPFINAFNALHIIPRWTFFAPNPGVRDYIMNDAVQAIKLLLKCENIGTAGIPFTVPYLLLLYYAAHAVPPEPDAMEFQIAIIESSGHDERKLECSFLSSFHGR